MESRLQEALWEGETLRWTGRPQPFPLLEATYKTNYLLTWSISGLVAVVVLGLLGASLAAGSRSLSNVIVMAVIALFLPVLLSTRPLLDKRTLEKQTVYAITDHRVLAMVKDEVMYMPLEPGLRSATVGKTDGCGDVCFGTAIGQPEQKRRMQAVVGLHGTDSHSERPGMLFYHISDPDSLQQFLPG